MDRRGRDGVNLTASLHNRRIHVNGGFVEEHGGASVAVFYRLLLVLDEGLHCQLGERIRLARVLRHQLVQQPNEFFILA